MSLFDIADLEVEDILAYLDRAEAMRRDGVDSTFAGRTVAAAFFEKSTRTRLSFEKAALGIGVNFLSFDPEGSSMSKGESLRDTVLTVAALGIEVLVVRHPSAGAARQIAVWTGCQVVNAGEGSKAHPTQTLLDLLTIRDRFGHFDGLSVALVGDIANSRVARGLISALPRLGGKLILAAPPTMTPVMALGEIAISPDLDGIIGEVDVAYLLRVQKERGTGSQYPSDAEYRNRFGMTSTRSSLMKPDAVVMHPGPINRGVEIDSAVADGDRSLILAQVANGVPVRMAVLARMLEESE